MWISNKRKHTWLLDVKVKFDCRLKLFNLVGWFFMSFVSQGWETKEIENQSRLNQNQTGSNLTHNIYMYDDDC